MSQITDDELAMLGFLSLFLFLTYAVLLIILVWEFDADTFRRFSLRSHIHMGLVVVFTWWGGFDRFPVLFPEIFQFIIFALYQEYPRVFPFDLAVFHILSSLVVILSYDIFPKNMALNNSQSIVDGFLRGCRCGDVKEEKCAAAALFWLLVVSYAMCGALRFDSFNYLVAVIKKRQDQASKKLEECLRLGAQRIQVRLRGDDEQTDVVGEACFFCRVNKKTCISDCCSAMTTCVQCSRNLYENKLVGDAKCMNCQANVAIVSRVS